MFNEALSLLDPSRYSLFWHMKPTIINCTPWLCLWSDHTYYSYRGNQFGMQCMYKATEALYL